MNGPLKLTQTPEFPWTMSDEQLHGYLDDLAANWPDAERALQPGRAARPGLGLCRSLLQIALQTPLETATRIVEAQMLLNHIPVLPTLRMPVLALYGANDPYYPTSLAEYIAGQTPDGSLVIFEESAHAPHYEEPDRFCEVVAEFGAMDASRS